MMSQVRGAICATAALVCTTALEAQRSRFLPLGFAGSNAVVLDMESLKRAGDVVAASTLVWSDSVFVLDGAQAVRRDDRYLVHCGLGRIFDAGSVYRDSTGVVIGGEVPSVEPPPPESWAPIARGSMIATVASYACFPEVAQRSRVHRVILVGEENTAYLRTIPSSVTVALGDSVILMRRTDTPIKVRYGRPEAPLLMGNSRGPETDVTRQLDEVSRERAAQNIIWVAGRQTYPDGFLAFQLRSDAREFIIPIRPMK